MNTRAISMFQHARRQPAELAWMHACLDHEAARSTGVELPYDQLRQLTVTALDRCIVLGRINTGQLAILMKFGETGPPRADSAVRAVWDAAIGILDSEMNRMVYPAAEEVVVKPLYFYGMNGSPFVDAANAWWWTLDCLDARAEQSRENSGLRIGRPCEPDDVVNALRRLDLSPVHNRTVVAWGRKRDTPPKGSEARRFWDEAMARLTEVLRAKGIVRPATRGIVENVRIPLFSMREERCPADRQRAPVQGRGRGLCEG